MRKPKRRAEDRRARIGTGYVPRDREIFAQLTVEEYLHIGLGARGDGVREIPPRIFELFPVAMPDLNEELIHRHLAV